MYCVTNLKMQAISALRRRHAAPGYDVEKKCLSVDRKRSVADPNALGRERLTIWDHQAGFAAKRGRGDDWRFSPR